MKSKFKPGDVMRFTNWIRMEYFDRLVVCIDDENVYYIKPNNEIYDLRITEVNHNFTLIHRPK